MIQPGRKYSPSSSSGPYRYGFNGKENDNDVRFENALDFGERSIYDPRLGRFISVDPNYRNLPDFSPYQYARNNPIMLIETGQDGIIPRWLWRSGIINPMSAGFIDAMVDDGIGIWHVVKTITAFNPGTVFYYFPGAKQIRKETKQAFEAVFQVLNDPILRTIALENIVAEGKKTVKDADAVDMAYASGYATWTVLSFFIGVGELSALAKTGKVGTGITKVLGLLSKSENKTNHLANIVRRSASYVNKLEWHHVIPDNLINNSVVQAGISAGYKFGDKLENLIPLEKFLKSNLNGTHGHAPKYDAQIVKAIQQFEELNPRYKNNQAKEFLEDIKNQIIKKIDESPSTKLNELDLKLSVKQYKG